MKFTARETYLQAAAEKLDKLYFSGRGNTLPNIRVSCGFPRSTKGYKAIGQCWDGNMSEDGTFEIFICPTQAEPIRVIDILLHEMIHAAVGLECKHRGPFRIMAREFGFAGKLTATYAEKGTTLHRALQKVADELGEYPHAEMTPKKKTAKKATGSVTFVSTRVETYKVTMRQTQVLEYGVPKDPWANDMVPVDSIRVARTPERQAACMAQRWEQRLQAAFDATIQSADCAEVAQAGGIRKIEFDGTLFVNSGPVRRLRKQAYHLNSFSDTTAIVNLYNLVAEQTGGARVIRFPDRKMAIACTWEKLIEYDIQRTCKRVE